jgi:hypothetical protein
MMGRVGLRFAQFSTPPDDCAICLLDLWAYFGIPAVIRRAPVGRPARFCFPGFWVPFYASPYENFIWYPALGRSASRQLFRDDEARH